MNQKTHRLGAALIAAALGFSSVAALAQPGHGNDRRDGPNHGQQRSAQRHEANDDRREARPAQQWHKGQRLPADYRGAQYVVQDWRGHHLSAPPRGYHWVQVGGDYVLAAIATGVIASLILGH